MRRAGTVIAEPCSACHGGGRIQAERTISVAVPPGADTGLRLFVGGEGDAGEPGARAAISNWSCASRSIRYSSVKARTCSSSVFLLRSARQRSGATLEVPTLTGRTKLTVPPGTQTATEFRVRNEGVPELRVNRQGVPVENTRTGDLRVTVVVETPTHLTHRQEELLREMAEIENKQVSPHRKSFFDKIKNLFTPSETDAAR